MNKKILITGSGTGLGRDAAINLAKRGHTVYATCHYNEEVKALNKLAKEQKLDISAFKLDILSKKDRMLVHNYEIDVLINNAAIGISGSASEINVESYRNIFETNVFATLELTQEVIKDMIKKRCGRIVFISSLAGRIAMPFFSPYSSTKHALEAIAVSLTKELNNLKNLGVDIGVTIIEPGAYATGFNQKMIESKFSWMKEKSYFKFMLNKLRKRELEKFAKIEQKTYDSIIKVYIKACEAKQLKQRYVAPEAQGLYTQLLRILGN